MNQYISKLVQAGSAHIIQYESQFTKLSQPDSSNQPPRGGSIGPKLTTGFVHVFVRCQKIIIVIIHKG